MNALTSPSDLFVIAVAVAVLALIVWSVLRSARRRHEREELRRRYGTEYDRTLAMHRNSREAVADLREREHLRERLQLRDLNEADHDLIRRHMAALQYRFVDDPADVLLQTERVVVEVLRAKGYPVGDDRMQAVRLFSVDHPEHAGDVRDVMEGNHHGDIDKMRESFLNARKTLQDVARISFVLGDAQQPGANETADLRVEHRSDVAPAGERTATR